MAKTIYVLHGPNRDPRATREEEANGHAKLSDVEKLCLETAERYGLRTDCRQADREDELIDFIREAQARNAVGIVVNAGGYPHASAALDDAVHDALATAMIPAVEVCAGDVHAGEPFRHPTFAARAAIASLCGFGIDGFRLAISGLAATIGAQATA
jgi:3-dehydroquinate dehydratase-2